MNQNRRRLLILGIMLCTILAATASWAQNPNSCQTNGYTSYSFTYVYNAITNQTTYQFTFCNNTPINSTYVNAGEFFIFDFPDPAPMTTPTGPSGWEFDSVGPKLFYATTSNPWWKTPPALAPGQCLGGFTYIISGTPDLDFTIVSHVQNVTDATGQVQGPLGTWFDCSREIPPVVDEPCIDVQKEVNPAIAQPGATVTYTVIVTNCGNVALTVTSIVDNNPAIASLAAGFLAANGGSAVIPVGGSVTINYNYTLQGTELNPFENCVTVNATGGGTNVTDTDCATLQILQQQDQPSISLVKTVNPEVSYVGGTVTYKFVVCNNGNADLTVETLTDTVLGNLLPAFIAANGGSDSLPIEACVTFYVPYKITCADPNPLYNFADVTGVDDEGNEVEDSSSARVDIGPAPFRRCFLPVTFTQQGWSLFADPNNPALPYGILYNKFPRAFANFTLYGKLYKGQVVVGVPGKYTLAFTGTTSNLTRLSQFLPQNAGCSQLFWSYVNPLYLVDQNGVPSPNNLAGEALALTMNIAYNDMRLMPRTPGYDLEKFTLTQGLFRGKTVGQVLDVANKVLAGALPASFGLQSCTELTTILMNINKNYEWVDYNTYIDRGYLKPNRLFGQPDPAHAPVVP